MSRVVALVTGAGKGIGAACALALSDAGHRVALLARSEDDLDSAGQGPARRVARRTRRTCSTRQRSTPRSRRSRRSGDRSRSSSSTPAPRCRRRWCETTDEDWQRMLDLNLTAPFRCLRRALPAMTEAGCGPGRRDRLGRGQARRRTDRGVHRQQARRARPGPHRGDRRSRASGVTVNAVCPGLRRHPDDRRVRSRTSPAGTGRSEDEAREILAQHAAHRPAGDRRGGRGGGDAVRRQRRDQRAGHSTSTGERSRC